MSTKLTDRMLDRVLQDIARWRADGRQIGRIAINGSSADFRRDDFAERILSRLQTFHVPPSLLELEVTETVFLGQAADTVERALHALRAAGVTIALDDFGTGYASLSHLQQFPVDVLKIDRSFVSRLDGIFDLVDRKRSKHAHPLNLSEIGFQFIDAVWRKAAALTARKSKITRVPTAIKGGCSAPLFER